jgi:hypothetical protein
MDRKAFMALNAGLAASTCQPGQGGARVGLLPGLRPECMQTFQKEEKKRRALREDLSMLAVEEKVERRKPRARIYSHHARKRDEAKMQALAEDVDMMQASTRTWKMINVCTLSLLSVHLPLPGRVRLLQEHLSFESAI